MNDKMELEEAIKELESLSPSETAIKTVLQALESYKRRYELAIEQNVKDYKNSIPKKKIREKLKEVQLQLPNVIVGGRRNSKTLEYGIKLGRIKAYEELLEGK